MSVYTGKLLEVDLTSGSISTRRISEDALRRFIGGSALAAKLFLDRVSPHVDPLSADNALFILTGPLTGSSVAGSGRFSICTRSPLTGIWGESSCGGTFGPELKFAGWDGIIVEGASPKPAYLIIEDDRVEIRDAAALWGRDTYETVDALNGEHASVLAIGQAGENQVKYACVVNDKASFAGRCGMGAVMGAKRLKAIAVRGSGKVAPAWPEPYQEARKAILKKIVGSPRWTSFRNNGTNAGMAGGMKTGNLPARNWSVGDNTAVASKLTSQVMNEKYLVGRHSCYACPMGCKRVVRVKEGPYQSEGPGPEYETCASFGSMLMIDDLAAVIKINELCNRYGLDTISCGTTIAFAMDCYEKGLVDSRQAGGELTWGNASAVIQTVGRIARKQGFGAILAEGSREAAHRIGANAADYAVEVKGLELPMHDPRSNYAMGLAYATSIRGACHLQHTVLATSGATKYPEIGLNGAGERRSNEGKAALTVISENLGMIWNAVPMCEFVMPCLSMGDLLDALRTATGFDYTMEEMMQCGERAWLLKRGLGNLMGMRADDDRLPLKVLTPTREGGAANSVPDIAFMLREYYQVRGLDAEGRPHAEKLAQLGLGSLAARLFPTDR